MKNAKKHIAAFLAVSVIAMGFGANAHAQAFGRVLPLANTASVSQSGQGNAGAITQNGAGNEAGLQQYGRNNTGTINQDGSNNTACLVQLGRNLDGAIVQSGDNQSTGIIQTRRGAQEIPAEFCSARNGQPRGLWMAAARHFAKRVR